MTCSNKQGLIEKEARLQEAMATVLNKKHTIPSSTCAFIVSHQILDDQIQLNGKPLYNKANETE